MSVVAPNIPHMAYDFQVTFDAADPHTLADWWADALGWVVEPTDEAFIRRMIRVRSSSRSWRNLNRERIVWSATREAVTSRTSSSRRGGLLGISDVLDSR